MRSPDPQMLRELEAFFTYHAPTPEQIPRYQAVRDAAKAFALVIASNVPEGQGLLGAIWKLRECVMVANQAIALEGKT